MCVLAAQSCPALCDAMNCSLPGSSVHGTFQGRILEWVARPSSRNDSGRSFQKNPPDLSNPGIEPASLMSPALAGGFFTTSVTWER